MTEEDLGERRPLGDAQPEALASTLLADAGAQPAPGDTPGPRAPDASPERAATLTATHGLLAARALSLTAGSVIQHYELIRPLGRGGMGVVYLARDTGLGRLVAIKLLTKHSGERAQRFLREARATAQMTHENIIVIHELGEHGGTPYMVLEYLKGKTLDEVRSAPPRAQEEQEEEEAAAPTAAPLPASRAVELMIPVVRALVFAHARGIVHRDLKPSNIMVTDGGVVKVLDFGIAKWISGPNSSKEGRPAEERAEEASALSLTAEGARIGSAPYMSPEQWKAEPVDHRTDIWAVGLILAELILGQHPLAPLSLYSLATVGRLDIPMPSMRALRPELGKLGAIIDRCLIKRREDRLGSATELLFELEALAPGRLRPSVDEEQNPYPGLSAYQESDAGRFFGRGRAIMEVVSRLGEQPLVAVVGLSGAGKSSFVRAGVIPALSRAGEAYQALTMRPGPHPVAALADLVLTDPLETVGERAGSPAEAREDLIARLRAAPGFLGTTLRARARRKRQRIVLFIDQFEESYTLVAEAERAVFFACLSGVADDPGSPLRVLLALRSDFLDRVTEAEAAQIGLHRGVMPLSPMTREGLREALLRPLEAVEHRFDQLGLIEEMLDTLEQTAGALPLLSFTAARLWEERDRARRVLTEESYRRIGGVAGTLAGHAEAVLTGMPTEERKLARTALLRLVTPERTRALCTRGELCALSASPAAMDRVLQRLIDARLLTVESSGESEAMVELVHESLIASFPTLARWVAENQADAVFVSRLRHAAREWEASGGSEDLLWRGQAAEGARRWRAQYAGELSPVEERYLAAVAALSERARRVRRRGMTALIGALTVIAAGGLYLALRADWAAARARTETARAEQQARRADEEATRAQGEAVQARNAARMAAARELQADPTTVLALLREVEPPEVPRGFAELSRWALQAGVAEAVFTHPEQIMPVVFSPDGKRVATASWDKTARVWNTDGTGEPLVLRGHEDWVRSAAFSPDGKRIVTASRDKTARVWSADGMGEPLVLRGHQEGLWSAAFSPDGKRVATASRDKTARVWSADGMGEPLVLRGHQAGVGSAAFSPDGKRVVTLSSDKTARVWNADGTGEPLVLGGRQEGVRSAAFSPDGKRIVTASYDKTARVWNADGTGEPLVLRGHEDQVRSAAFSPDGKRVVTASMDKTARVWNADGTGEPVVLRGHQAGVESAAFSPDSKRVVTAAWDKTARVWSADGTGEVLVLCGHQHNVLSAAFSPDGKRVVTMSLDKTARVWSVAGTRPLVLRGHQEVMLSAEFSPDGKRVVTASGDKTARLWNADGTGEPVVLRGHQEAILSAAFSADSKRVITVSSDKTARVWNADGTGEPVVLRGHEEPVYSASFSPDGKRVVTASEDKTARVWNADGTGEPVVLRGHQAGVISAAFSADGKRVVTASGDNTARVWNADGTGEPVVLRGHEKLVYSASFSPDGKRVVTASQDRTVRVWNADGTGGPVVLRGHEDEVMLAAFSADGKRVVTLSGDKTARVWNADGTGEPVVLRGHQEAILSVAFSPDGKRVVTASGDRTVRVWNTDGTGEPLVLRGSDSAYNKAEFSPDGKRIVAASDDKTAWIWTDLVEIRGVDDPKLWTATTYCMPIERRMELLHVPEATARTQKEACQRRVEAARAAALTPR